MKHLLFAALLASAAVAEAAALGTQALVQAVLSQTSPADEDDEDEDEDEDTPAPATTPAPPPATGTATPPPAAGAPAATAGAPTAASARVNERAQVLVSGAPLHNPNVAVHTVERKLFSDKSKHELALFPAVAQLNGKFTQHYGTALSYTYHLHENFAFQVTPQWNWFNTESSFNQELIDKVREEAQAATSLLLSWGVLAGAEVVPIYGKFAWYEHNLLQYSVVISGGAGYGGTRHQLKPKNESGPATFGETGNRFLGSLGGGFRVQFGNRFAVRLEVRDLVYTARVDEVNGCNFRDLSEMDVALRTGRDPAESNVRASCQRGTFGKTRGRPTDVPLALALVRDPTSDVLNLVGVYGGASFIF